MEILKYNQSIPGPNSYSISTTLNNRGVSMKTRLVDTSLKHLKDVHPVSIRSKGQALTLSHLPSKQGHRGSLTPNIPTVDQQGFHPVEANL